MQYVNPGTVVAKIKNNTTIKATVNLKESDLGKVKTGQKVILKLSKEDKNGYEGRVKAIASSANSVSRVFSCLVEVNNAKRDTGIRPCSNRLRRGQKLFAAHPGE